MAQIPIECAKDRAHDLLARAEADLAAGRITEAEWYARGVAVFTPAYLAGDNPRAQSGHSGDEDHWRQARRHLCDAFHRSGSFLDVGCANGYLMESVRRWAAESDLDIEPYGLDLSPQLAALARVRLPEWADRIWVGNAIDWVPPRRFDFVRTGLEYVPSIRQADLVARLLDLAVAPGGRLIIGSFSEERDDLVQPGESRLPQRGRRGAGAPAGRRVDARRASEDASRRECDERAQRSGPGWIGERAATDLSPAAQAVGPTVEQVVTGWGFRVAGRTQRPHYCDERLFYKSVWIQA